MVDLEAVFGRVREYGRDIMDDVIDGVVLILLDYAHTKLVEWDWYYKNVVVKLKQFEEPLFYIIVYAIAKFGKGKIEYLAYLEIALMYGVYKLGRFYLVKPPFGILVDATTIEVYNLDPDTSISVYVDGNAISFTTAPKTDSSGNAKITLPNALASGEHKILVHTGYKATFFKGYV